MAEEHLTTITGKRWQLLEKMPPGPTKNILAEIQKELEEIHQANNVILTLARIEQRLEDNKTINLATDTLFALGCEIETCIDGVYHNLNKICISGPGRGCSMNAETPKPHVFLTLAESDKLISEIDNAHAMADLLFMSCQVPDGPNPESMVTVAGMLFTALSNIRDLVKQGEADAHLALRSDS